MPYREVTSLNEMNLSQWMEKQMLWLHSTNVEFSGSPFEPFFTRGAVEFITDNLGHRVQAYTHYNRDDKQGGRPPLPISRTTPVYVDMLPAFYFVGETYEGTTLNTIAECQRITAQHTRQSNAYGKIKEEGEKDWTNLRRIYTEHRLSIDVPNGSALARNFYYPVEPGTRIEGWVVGYVNLIESLDPGEYALEFGGQGPGAYETKSTYRLRVR